MSAPDQQIPTVPRARLGRGTVGTRLVPVVLAVAWRSAWAYRPGGPRVRDPYRWRQAIAIASLPAWIVVVALTAAGGGLVRSGTASVTVTSRTVIARVSGMLIAALLLPIGLLALVIAEPWLAGAVAAILLPGQVLAVLFTAGVVPMLSGLTRRDRAKVPRRRDPDVQAALRRAREYGAPDAQIVTVGTLAAAPGRVDDIARLALTLVQDQRHVLITAAATDQLYARYRQHLGFQPASTGRRGLYRPPGPLSSQQTAYLQRLTHIRLD